MNLLLDSYPHYQKLKIGEAYSNEMFVLSSIVSINLRLLK